MDPINCECAWVLTAVEQLFCNEKSPLGNAKLFWDKFKVIHTPSCESRSYPQLHIMCVNKGNSERERETVRHVLLFILVPRRSLQNYLMKTWLGMLALDVKFVINHTTPTPPRSQPAIFHGWAQECLRAFRAFVCSLLSSAGSSRGHSRPAQRLGLPGSLRDFWFSPRK